MRHELGTQRTSSSPRPPGPTARPAEHFPRGSQPEFWLQSIGLENGVVFYNTLYGPRRPSMPKRGLPFWIAPPLCITREQVDELLAAIDRTLGDWERKMGL